MRRSAPSIFNLDAISTVIIGKPPIIKADRNNEKLPLK
jgi:hypothetical protein